MRNIFTRLRSWYTANRKYDGFVTFVWFSFMTLLLLVLNVVKDTIAADWFIWVLWLQTVLYNAAFWMKAKRYDEFSQSLIDVSNDEIRKLANQLDDTRGYLRSANRRRKRAEKKLKKKKCKMYRYALERNVRLLHILNDRKSH